MASYSNPQPNGDRQELDDFRQLDTSGQLFLMFKSIKATETNVADIKLEVSRQKERIAFLEAENKALRSELEQVKDLHNFDKPSSEIKLCGVPASDSTPARDIVSKILKHVNLEHLTQDIIDTRPLITKTRNPGTSNRTNTNSLNYIISVKSDAIRAHIIQTKRNFGKIKYSDIFSGGSDSYLDLYEMLPKIKHKLLLAAKDRARQVGYKSVWVFDGNIYVRKDDSSDKVNIRIESDLDKII